MGGNKPAFLLDEKSQPLFRVDHKTESLAPVDAVPNDQAAVHSFLAQGKFFQGGNAQQLHKLLQITSGDRLLYVGDHIYADVLRSKRTLGWRTCLIVPELSAEIIAHKKSRKLQYELMELRKEQFWLQSRIDELEVSNDFQNE